MWEVGAEKAAFWEGGKVQVPGASSGVSKSGRFGSIILPQAFDSSVASQEESAWVRVHVCEHVCGDQRTVLSVPWELPPFFLETGSLCPSRLASLSVSLRDLFPCPQGWDP